MLAATSLVYDRNRTNCKYFSSSLVGRNSGHNSFVATTGVRAQISKNIGSLLQYSTYLAWKYFMQEVILYWLVIYTKKEAYRIRENDWLSKCELETFVVHHYVRGQYGKSHLLHLLYNRIYLIPIRSESISHVRFTAVLKHLSFDDKPSRIWTGPGVDRFTAIRVVFQTSASMC